MTDESVWEEPNFIAAFLAQGSAKLATLPKDVPRLSDRWVKANALLAVMHEPGYTEWVPGSFEGRLLEAALFADRSNLRKLAMLWPTEAEVVDLYKNVDGGMDRLKQWAKGDG